MKIEKMKWKKILPDYWKKGKLSIGIYSAGAYFGNYKVEIVDSRIGIILDKTFIYKSEAIAFVRAYKKSH